MIVLYLEEMVIPLIRTPYRPLPREEKGRPPRARTAYSSVLPYGEKEVLSKETSRQRLARLSGSDGSRPVKTHASCDSSFSDAGVDYQVRFAHSMLSVVDPVGFTISDDSCSTVHRRVCFQ